MSFLAIKMHVLSSCQRRTTIYPGQVNKIMQGKLQSVIVELQHKSSGNALILCSNYNTGGEEQVIPNEI